MRVVQTATPLLLLTVSLVSPSASLTPNYGNPFAHGNRCGKGQSKIKLKFSGQHHKICAPSCNQNSGGEDISCPVSTVKAEGTCISVSNRRLCVLSCTSDGECPSGASCHSTPSVSLCVYSKTSVVTENAGSTHQAKETYGFDTYAPLRLNSHPKVSLTAPRSHCVDSCLFASDGRCEDGGTGSVATYCELGSDCSDCGPRTISKDFAPATYVVKKRDTLNSIGMAWGVRAGALELWNRIGDPESLGGVNQQLIVTYEGYLEEQRSISSLIQEKRKRAQRASRVKALIRLLGEQRHKRFLETLASFEESDDRRAAHESLPRCKVPSLMELERNQPGTDSQPMESTDVKGDLRRLEDRVRTGTNLNWFWEPMSCEAQDSVAVIVPFRNRETYLPALLARLHPLLRKQLVRYRIFVVDQVDDLPFNRAKLLNIGAVEAMRSLPLERKELARNLMDNVCFIFHDVDLHPVSDTTPYFCPKGKNPHHLSVKVDTHGAKCVYGEIFGGVTSLTVSQMITVNGFSNDYWGWGGEDDDMSQRIRRGAGLKIERPTPCGGVCHWEAHCLDQMGIIEGYEEAQSVENASPGHYVMVGGKKGSVDGSKAMDPSQRSQLAIASERYYGEGLTTLKYELVSVEHSALFSRIRVKL